MWVAFANAKATHIFFSKNISIYAIFNAQSFNDTLTKDIVSFEQLGPGPFKFKVMRVDYTSFTWSIDNFNIMLSLEWRLLTWEVYAFLSQLPCTVKQA